ncbi:MAG: type II toxin-antitoxin system VapC family toxin [Nanobdellota archaeon]
MKGRKEAKNCLDKFKGEKIFTTEIALFEVGTGYYFGEKERKGFDQFMDFMENVDIIPSMSHFALEAAEVQAELLKKGKPIEIADCLTAGMMIRQGIRKILTKNTEHFSRIKGIEAIGY